MGILSGAFNMILRIHSRPAVLRRYVTSSTYEETDIRVTPSNYFRFASGPELTTIRGREFVIPVSTIVTPFSGAIIKKGDRIVDSIHGVIAIDEVIEMPDLGGATMGFRCRCE